MPRVVIALGSNLGDPLGYIVQAVDLLAALTTGLRCSSVFSSDPMYVLDQPSFLNAVVVGHTDLGPRSLLAALKQVETALGRSATTRNGPREIDLDLVAYGSLAYRFAGVSGTELVIPHPRLAERRFVLEPLAEVAPDLLLPGLSPLVQLLDSEEVRQQRLAHHSHAPVPV